MKLRRIISVATVLLLFICTISSAFAYTTKTVTGTTNPGTMGSTDCTGKLRYANNSSAGSDWAKSGTAADSIGTLGAYAKIYFTDSTGNTSLTKYATAYSSLQAITAKVYARSGCHGYRAKSGHSYSSTKYGSWTAYISSPEW